MTELAINAISNVRSAESSAALARPQAPAQPEIPVAPPVSKSSTPIQDKTPFAEKSVKHAESSSAAVVGNLSNVALQFRVDEKTNDVTVFVVDRNSKRVLRSIPANELAKLQAGDLLKLTA